MEPTRKPITRARTALQHALPSLSRFPLIGRLSIVPTPTRHERPPPPKKGHIVPHTRPPPSGLTKTRRASPPTRAARQQPPASRTFPSRRVPVCRYVPSLLFALREVRQLILTQRTTPLPTPSTQRHQTVPQPNGAEMKAQLKVRPQLLQSSLKSIAVVPTTPGLITVPTNTALTRGVALLIPITATLRRVTSHTKLGGATPLTCQARSSLTGITWTARGASHASITTITR